MRIYLAGPMSGIPEFNFPRFFAKAKELRDRGHEVFNPCEYEMDTYRENLQLDISWICRYATAMYMLKGWEQSPGARAEHAVGQALRLEFMYE